MTARAKRARSLPAIPTPRLSRSLGWPLLAAVALIVVTLAVLGADARFLVRDGPVMPNLDFSEGLRHWIGRGPGVFVRPGGEAPELVIHASERSPPPHVLRRVPRPGRFAFLRVTGEVRTAALETGGETWYGGHLLLIAYQGNRRVRHWPYEIASLRSDAPWRRVSRIVPVNPDASALVLAAYAAGAAGALSLRRLSVEGLEERKVFRHAGRALIGAWITLWAWASFALLRRAGRTPTRLLAVLAANVVLVVGLAPQPGMEDWLRSLLFRAQDIYFSGRELLSPAPPGEPLGAAPPSSTSADESEPPAAPSSPARGAPPAAREYWTPPWRDIDKKGHLATFVLLTLVTLLGYRQLPLAPQVAALTAFAASIQTVQGFSDTREGDLADLRADLIGIAGGACAFALARALWRRRRRGVIESGQST